jgi:hypothetical protein
MTPGWYRRLWWRVDNENLSCTVEERETVLTSSLAFLHFRFLNETADANLTTMTGIVCVCTTTCMCNPGTVLCRLVGRDPCPKLEL